MIGREEEQRGIERGREGGETKEGKGVEGMNIFVTCMFSVPVLADRSRLLC